MSTFSDRSAYIQLRSPPVMKGRFVDPAVEMMPKVPQPTLDVGSDLGFGTGDDADPQPELNVGTAEKSANNKNIGPSNSPIAHIPPGAENAGPMSSAPKKRGLDVRTKLSMPHQSSKGFKRIEDGQNRTSTSSSSGPKIFIPKIRPITTDQQSAADRYDEEGAAAPDALDANSGGMPSEETPLRQRRGAYRPEYGKTVVAAVCVFLATLAGSFVVAYINRYSVMQEKSLPDLVFNLVPEQTWAWEVADVTVIVCPVFTFLVLLFHKHNSIAFRRLCVLAAALYFLRALFLMCTYLPPPFHDFKQRCLPANFTDDTLDVFWTTLSLVFRVGYSSDESQFMCGDTIYSGHAMLFTLVCLTLRYYTPKALCPYPLVMVVAGSVLGISCVIISRQHYTIDVVVAVVVTCAIFHGYRSWTIRPRACRCFGTGPPFRFRPLFFAFLVFERNVPRGPLPAELAWPFPGPAMLERLFDRCNERAMMSGGSGDTDAMDDIDPTVSKQRRRFDV